MKIRDSFFKIIFISFLEIINGGTILTTFVPAGLGVTDADQVKAKQNYDPKGLLNPGKLAGWVEKEKFID